MAWYIDKARRGSDPDLFDPAREDGRAAVEPQLRAELGGVPIDLHGVFGDQFQGQFAFGAAGARPRKTDWEPEPEGPVKVKFTSGEIGRSVTSKRARYLP